MAQNLLDTWIKMVFSCLRRWWWQQEEALMLLFSYLCMTQENVFPSCSYGIPLVWGKEFELLFKELGQIMLLVEKILVGSLKPY